MAGFSGVRRILLLNALIFAVLASASALAYYGFGKEPEEQRELDLMADLAEEQVLSLESHIIETDTKLLLGVNLDEMGEKLEKLIRTTGAALVSLYVLDDRLTLVPDGSQSTRDNSERLAYRNWFLERIVPMLALQDQPIDRRGHLYLNIEGKPYLFSFAKRVSKDRTFYVVIETDLVHIFVNLFPDFFNSTKRLYQVVDDQGQSRYGPEFGDLDDAFVVEQPFLATLDGWKLRVAQKDPGGPLRLERRRLVNSVQIGGAVVVIVVALAVLGAAFRRERRLNNLKSEFISNVSHELKTPLSIISLFGEMLANGRTKSPEQAKEYAEIIWRESVRLSSLIDNVLDFAKIERGMDVYEFAEGVDITEVVEHALELASRRIAAAEMTLETQIDPELPLVRLDANAFTLAVLNLIDNAVKYAASGKKISVSLTASSTGDGVMFSVRDWGPGIATDEQARIFERFYRAKAVRLKPIRGSGIGLALVQHIVQAHGGTVSVRSEPDSGSTFQIRLPVNRARELAA